MIIFIVGYIIGLFIGLGIIFLVNYIIQRRKERKIDVHLDRWNSKSVKEFIDWDEF